MSDADLTYEQRALRKIALSPEPPSVEQTERLVELDALDLLETGGVEPGDDS